MNVSADLPETSAQADLTVVVLTLNEEQHIERCLQSAFAIARQVFVVDSYSTDRTVELAHSMGADVIQHAWEHNHSRQLNWAIDSARISGKWVLRLDADEYVTPDLAREIAARLPAVSENVSGIYLNRRVHFLGRWLRWGDVHPMWILRIWRHGRARCESRWMDEHMRVLQGETIRFNGDIVDENLNDLTWWTAKHNGYARREAADLLNIKHGFTQSDGLGAEAGMEQARTKRRLKEGLYSPLPLFLRPMAYFLYRYLFRLGFLDGVPGLVWHVLQSFWYRFLVDANIYEIERRAKRENVEIAELIKRDWQLK
jgi:glycosyltransferase involved in cell wall biosynthesis